MLEGAIVYKNMTDSVLNAKCELSAEHSHKDAKRKIQNWASSEHDWNTDPSFNQTSEISSHVLFGLFLKTS